jgi:hypothetical protein
MYANSNVLVDANRGFVRLVGAGSNATVTVGNNNGIFMSSSNNTTLNTQNLMTFSTCNFYMTTSCNFEIRGHNDNGRIIIDSSAVRIQGTRSGGTGRTEVSTGVFSVDVTANINTQAPDNFFRGNNTLYEYSQTMTTRTSNFAATMRTASFNTQNTYVTSSNINLTSLNGVNRASYDATNGAARVDATTSFAVTASNSATNYTTVSGTNGVLSLAASDRIEYTAANKMSMFMTTSTDPTLPTFEIIGNEVRVRGNLLINGSLNTSNLTSVDVQQTNLKIQDKTIVLAMQGSNNPDLDPLPADGEATNDKAGIIIDGTPAQFANNSNVWPLYRKSFLWNIGTNGVPATGTNDISGESFWELQGGSFRMTKKRLYTVGGSNTAYDVSFGWRINEYDELELVKKVWNSINNNYSFKRITKFGRTGAPVGA